MHGFGVVPDFLMQPSFMLWAINATQQVSISTVIGSVCSVGASSKSNFLTGPEGSRRLRLPDIKTVGT
jgi:hypothetical protein